MPTFIQDSGGQNWLIAATDLGAFTTATTTGSSPTSILIKDTVLSTVWALTILTSGALDVTASGGISFPSVPLTSPSGALWILQITNGALAVSAGVGPFPYTTTFAFETGNNTSCNASYNQTNFPANFTGTTWTDTSGTTLAVNSAKYDDSFNAITPAHVSPASIKTMIPSYTGKWYAHIEPWFRFKGGGGHIDNGTNSDSTSWVSAAMDDIQARGFDGIIVDWYGVNHYEDAVTQIIQFKVASMTNFTYCIMIDTGDFGVTSGYGTTAQLEAHLSYINTRYFGTTNYQQIGGNPVVYLWGVPVGGVDYNTAKASIGITQYWVNQGPGQLVNAWCDAVFDWVQPWSSGVPADRYNAAATNSFLTLTHNTPKGVVPVISPGFNGYLTHLLSWSKGRYIPRDSGKCWITQAATVGANLPLGQIGMYVPTWNDWEEGTAVEDPIQNDIAVTASVAANILSWSIAGGTGDETTLTSYKIMVVDPVSGTLAAIIGTQPTGGSNTFDLTTIIGWGSATFSLYVIAVGKPCVRNQLSNAVSYSPIAGTVNDVFTFSDTVVGSSVTHTNPRAVTDTLSLSDSVSAVTTSTVAPLARYDQDVELVVTRSTATKARYDQDVELVITLPNSMKARYAHDVILVIVGKSRYPVVFVVT